MWMEIIFNIAYIATLWSLVALMFRRLPRTDSSQGPLAARFGIAFAVLGVGDTAHVGLRVAAYLGGPQQLIGWGALATSITVSLFYLILLDAWRIRFSRRLSVGYAILGCAGISRLALLIPKANEWSRVVAPLEWSIYRNIPLLVLGLAVATLFVAGALAVEDRVFAFMGGCIYASFALYVPVILLVGRLPALGMLMVPKTVAYLLIGFAAYARVFVITDVEVERAFEE